MREFIIPISEGEQLDNHIREIYKVRAGEQVTRKLTLSEKARGISSRDTLLIQVLGNTND